MEIKTKLKYFAIILFENSSKVFQRNLKLKMGNSYSSVSLTVQNGDLPSFSLNLTLQKKFSTKNMRLVIQFFK